MTLWLVALGGGLGAGSRFVVDGLIRARSSRPLPVATMTINVVGSLLLGLLTGLVVFHHVAGPWITIATTGFCGGFTTFSTAMVEAVRLVQVGELRAAATSVLGTLVAGVGAAALGVGLVALTA
ncbi:CrcB family protein [Actinotalea sp. M2MS4P-6]|uniref:fluoride efflux transporter FluC n=1 Tax=Actinotalea sp. M2MS4P-6 TaxID=2983762 RepID=UPI0021E3CCCD|nr:CrcB family protein [Actinotalea sp. M2MS4P-6]MCV2396252.1 CrcB family protein [Actinotalea sp. M2MS4P-6]